MKWYAWAIIGLLAINAALNILTIGKPRKPTTPGTAVTVLVLNGLVVWGIVSLAT